MVRYNLDVQQSEIRRKDLLREVEMRRQKKKIPGNGSIFVANIKKMVLYIKQLLF